MAHQNVLPPAAESFNKPADVAGKILRRISRVGLCAIAVPTLIHCDHPGTLTEGACHRRPHLMVRRDPVQQEEGVRSLPRLGVGNLDSVRRTVTDHSQRPSLDLVAAQRLRHRLAHLHELLDDLRSLGRNLALAVFEQALSALEPEGLRFDVLSDDGGNPVRL